MSDSNKDQRRLHDDLSGLVDDSEPEDVTMELSLSEMVQFSAQDIKNQKLEEPPVELTEVEEEHDVDEGEFDLVEVEPLSLQEVEVEPLTLDPPRMVASTTVDDQDEVTTEHDLDAVGVMAPLQDGQTSVLNKDELREFARRTSMPETQWSGWNSQEKADLETTRPEGMQLPARPSDPQSFTTTFDVPNEVLARMKQDTRETRPVETISETASYEAPTPHGADTMEFTAYVDHSGRLVLPSALIDSGTLVPGMKLRIRAKIEKE